MQIMVRTTESQSFVEYSVCTWYTVKINFEAMSQVGEGCLAFYVGEKTQLI